MQILYPSIKPNRSFYLDVDDIHQLYVEESGDENGIPVLFIHGGPGGGCSEQDRRFFNPEKYRIILFDQRGAGLSKPHAELRDNTTQHLIDDIEKIRDHLNIEKWVLFGGSWGSTLALLYAQSFPERVLGMVLRGIFLCRPADLQWFYQEGASHIFPDYWEKFIAPIYHDPTYHAPAYHDRHVGDKKVSPVDHINAYYDLLTSDNELEKMQAAKQWSLWEGRCATLQPSPTIEKVFGHPRLALALARIEAHYFVNRAFIRDNEIENNCDVLADIPSILIHGRYDMVCPLDNAFTLQKNWPNAQLRIIRDAGHSSKEPGISDALIKATDEMVSLLSNDQPA
ncbi:Proline iminopeptidase [gamma proteobacterium IMCC1989]|nr:Proline iminopeptidase [gamma proteobacterium IMCC1989]